MKVTYTTTDKRISADIDGNSQKDVFKGISKFQEIFEHENCGACDASNTSYSVRTIDGNDYYEKKCLKCGAALSYGQMKEGGGLFPKRKNSDGSWDTQTNGWHKWQPNNND